MVSAPVRLLIAGLLAGSGTLHAAMVEAPKIADHSIGSVAQALPAHRDLSTAGRLLQGNLPAVDDRAPGSGRAALLRTADAGPTAGSPIRSDAGSERSFKDPVASPPGLKTDDSLRTPGSWTLLLLAVGLVAYQLRRQAKSHRGIRF